MRNTALEEVVADWRDQSIEELRALRTDVLGLVEDGDLAREIGERFDGARFPFRHDRHVPRITVAGAVGDVSLEPGFRNPKPWTVEAKRELIATGPIRASRRCPAGTRGPSSARRRSSTSGARTFASASPAAAPSTSS